MNKTVKMRPIGAKPTPEELEQKREMEAKRAFLQKRNSLAEVMLANALHGGRFGRKPNLKPYVDAAVQAADYFMEKIYSVAITDVKAADEPEKEEE